MRISPIPTLSDEDALNAFATLNKLFGPEWLKSPGDHPLRVLWRRHDVISTMELLTLGHSASIMLPIAPRWTQRQVSLSKSFNQNQQKGALFEIIALAAFARAGHGVTPAPDSQPGYDGLVQAKNSGLIYRVSLKHHGPSAHEIAFREFCQSLEADLVTAARAARLTAVHANITGKLPWGRSKCKQLIDFFHSDVFARTLFTFASERSWTDASASVEVDHWSLRLSRMPSEGLAATHISYLLQMSTPQHQNEYQNLEEKLNKACKGLKQYSKDEKVPGLVMVHLPPTAHIEGYAVWVKHYLEQVAESLDAVFLYQPSVRRDFDNEKMSLRIYLNEVEAPKCRITGDDRRTVFFIGRLLTDPFHRWFGFEKIDDRYFYQAGNIFKDHSRSEEILINFLNIPRTAFSPGVVGTPGASIHIHEVSVDPKGEEVVFSPPVSPDDRLLIL